MKKILSSVFTPPIISIILLIVLFGIIGKFEDFRKDPYVWATIILGILSSWLLFWFHKKYNSEKPLNYIPNIWTGLGVFFTFVVIWKELSAVGGKNLDEQFIKTLITKVTSAFSTSIVGVCNSLIFSIWIKYILAEKENKEQKNNPEESPENILNNLYKNNVEILDLLQNIHTEQKSTKEVFNDKLEYLTEIQLEQSNNFKDIEKNKENTLDYIRIGVENFSKDFHNKLMSLLNNLEEDLKENSSKITQKNIEDTEKNLANLNIELNKIMKNNLQELMNVNKNELDTTLQEIQNAGKNSKDFLDNIAKNMQTTSQNTQEKFEDLSKSIQNFDTKIQETTSNVLEKNVKRLEKMFDRIEEWQKTVKIDLEEVNNQFAETVEQQTNFNDVNKNVLNEVKKQLESIENLREEVANLANNIGKYDEDMKKMESRINDIGNTITELDKIKNVLNLLNTKN